MSTLSRRVMSLERLRGLADRLATVERTVQRFSSAGRATSMKLVDLRNIAFKVAGECE